MLSRPTTEQILLDCCRELMTNVLHSLTDAHFLGYNCVLVQDCCGTTSPDFCHEGTLWNVKKCFGFVTKADNVISAMPKKAAG